MQSAGRKDPCSQASFLCLHLSRSPICPAPRAGHHFADGRGPLLCHIIHQCQVSIRTLTRYICLQDQRATDELEQLQTAGNSHYRQSSGKPCSFAHRDLVWGGVNYNANLGSGTHEGSGSGTHEGLRALLLARLLGGASDFGVPLAAAALAVLAAPCGDGSRDSERRGGMAVDSVVLVQPLGAAAHAPGVLLATQQASGWAVGFLFAVRPWRC